MGCSQSIEGSASPGIVEARRHKMKNKNLKRNSVDLTQAITQKIQIISSTLTQVQLAFATQRLEGHQLFSSLSKGELRRVCQEMVWAKATGRYVFKQGQVGSCFFLVFKGKVEVEIDEKLVRSLDKGQTFGELALLFKTARSASISCTVPNSQFLVMKPALYRRALQRMRLQENARNCEAVRAVPLFSSLTNKQKYTLANTVKQMAFAAGERIFRAGDDAQSMYIISEGTVRIQIEGKNDITLIAGQIFGEASLQEGMRRGGTATAVNNVTCSMISRKDIEATLGSSITHLKHYNVKKWALMRSTLFKHLNIYEINNIITQFVVLFAKDKTILDPEQHKGFVICLEGKINGCEEGIVFNEDQWTSKSLGCGKLVKNEDGNYGFLSYKKASTFFQGQQGKKKVLKSNNVSCKAKSKAFLKDFQYLKKLGEGQFGQVYLVKNIQYGTNLYAIKCLSKSEIRKQEMQLSVKHQKQILQKTVFPYIVGYVKAFHDKNYVFLLMQYIQGKEMFDVIREVKSMGIEMVKYYFACLMVSIEYLHNNSIVYRDLKPENSVVDYKGKVYLIDLGTAKQLTSDSFFKTFTIIGTPHYMAPQVFQGNGYSFEVDLWSLGCILYEFMCFGLPFGENSSGDPYAVYTAIKKGNLNFPKFMKDENSKKLINSLLLKNPKQRSGTTFQKIRKHDFFKNFDWAGLLDQTINPPYIPKDFRNNQSLNKFDDIMGKDLLKHLYKTDKDMQIQQWNGEV